MAKDFTEIAATVNTPEMGKRIADAVLALYPQGATDEHGLDKAWTLAQALIGDISYQASMFVALGRAPRPRK